MKLTLILFFFFTFYNLSSQTIIKGRIVNERNEILENVSVVLENLNDGSVVEFSISDSKGAYRIETNEKDLKFRIVITALNFEKESLEIENKSQTINFVLKEQITQLEEVKIDVKSIQQKGDTLTYDVKAFEGKEDRTLSDVLKKIPGIEVDDNGRIKYQGKSINKFYVEGKDLMAGSYGTLTNSMPKDAVSKLQVLENHQPIKRLKDYIPSDKAAINVKLKKDITLTGRAETGIGESPFLWNVKATPMVFTKKYQYLFNYKSNNVGDDVTQELQTFSFDEGFEGLILNNQIGSWISISESELPKIEQSRYFFNKTHLFSANVLTNLSTDWEFKANANYYNNKINRYGTQQSRVTLYDENGNIESIINYSRINDSELNNSQMRSQLIFTKNTDKSFLKNTTTFQDNWGIVNGFTILNSSDVSQNLQSPSFSFQNSASSIFLIGKRLINFKSVFNYINDKQKYKVSPYSNIYIPEFPLIDAEKVIQNLNVETVSFSNEVSFFFSIKKFSIFPTIGFDIEHKKLNTGIVGENPTNQVDFGNDFKNNLIWNKFVPTVSFSVNYVGESLTMNSSFPFKFNSLKIGEENNDFNKRLNKMSFEPNFLVKYKFNTELSKTIYGSISTNFGSINNLYPAYVFSSLNITRQNSDIQQSVESRIGGNFEYKLILHNLFLNLNYEYRESNSNVTNSQNILENGQIVFEQLATKSKSNGKSINFEISKFLPKVKTKLTLSAALNNNISEFIVNDSFTAVSAKGQSFKFKVNNDYFTWLGFDYSISYITNKRSKASNSNLLQSNLITTFYPKENHSISICKDDFIYNFESQKFKNQFIDLSYQYILKKSKIDFELKWTNVLNVKKYEEVVLNNYSYTYSSFNLRPSQLLVSIKFNF